MDGVLLVDKPPKLTSHDVVARVRRALGTRSVGHAGTLDPMATGLLVALVGDATKLSAWLTLDRKRYLATVRFGAATDTLDADGAVTARAPEGAPHPNREAIEAALARSVGPMMQVPPAVSAIKVGGVAMHERARRGEDVELAPRPVTLERAELLAVRDGECDLDLTVSKGFYVRSLARDLAAGLGTLGHLSALRRTESGAFTLDGALDAATLERASRGDEAARAAVRALVLPVASAAARAMRTVTVDDATAKALRQGRRPPCAEPDGTVLALDAAGAPVCVATVAEGLLKVERGFAAPGA